MHLAIHTLLRRWTWIASASRWSLFCFCFLFCKIYIFINKMINVIIYSLLFEYVPLLVLTEAQLFKAASLMKFKRLSFEMTWRMWWDVRVLASFDVVISALDVIMYSRKRSNALETMTGTCDDTLPISSSNCMIFFIRAWLVFFVI